MLFRSKYPLAIINKALEVLGKDILVAYDIGCSFKKTLSSSTLGPTIEAMCLQMLIPAFHCYPHNWLCQLQNHPLYFKGIGLEDFETCERLFSFTNGCAGSTRHTSKYHRAQILDGQFQRNDREQYASLGMYSLPYLVTCY